MSNLTVPSALLVATVLLGPTISAEADPMSRKTRRGLETLLKSKVARIDRETTADGLKYRRGTFSKRLVPVGDTFLVSFIKDAPGPEVLQSDRFLLTLQEGPRGKWSVAEEQLKGSYRGLVRSSPGNETFHRFARLDLDREGLRVTAGPGTMIVDHLLGKPHQIVVLAEDLSYRYAPPEDQGFYQHRILEQERAADFIFRPQLFTVDCVPGSCESFLERELEGVEPIAREDLDAGPAAHYDRWLARENRERQADPFRGFRRRPEPGRPQYTLSIKRHDDHWIRLRYDTWAADEVVFSATGYGPRGSEGAIYAHPSAATRLGQSADEVDRREDLDALDYDLTGLKGEISLALTDDELVTADLTFTLRIKRHLRELPFSLRDLTRFVGRPANDRNPAITVDALSDEAGRDLFWVRTGTAGGLVVFPDELLPGTSIALRIQFRNRGSIIQISPSYSYMDRGGWLPFVRPGDAIEDFDLTVTVPARYTVLGAGTRVSEESRGSVSVTRWVTRGPVRFPTLIFGDYVVDTPRTVAEKSDGTRIPVTIHVDRHSMTDWGIRPKQLQPLAEQAVNALNIYRTLFGVDYPYGKLDLVNDFSFFGGQAPGSIIYLGNAAFRSETTLAEAFANPMEGRALSRVLVAHEVAHQWWGAAIGAANAKNSWFVEALAEYSAALFAEIVASNGFRDPERGKKAYMEQVDRWRSMVLNNDPLASVQHAGRLWSDGGDRAALYAKGPYVFHMLRTTFGDEKFFEFLSRLGQQLAGRDIVARDIQRVAESSLGGVDRNGDPYRIDLEWFFDQWIRGIGIPEYALEYNVRATEDGKYVVEGFIDQRVVAGRRRRILDGVHFRGMVPITVLGSDKREYGTQILVDGPRSPFQFKVPVKPLEVSLNANGEVLAHDVRAP